MSTNFFRPAVMSPDPYYPFSDPGHEYIAGLAEVWMGGLARRMGVENKRVTAKQLENVYQGKTPDGSTQLFTRPLFARHQPVIGGNFETSLSMNAFISAQDEPTKKFLERLVLESADETVRNRILPDLYERRGRGGRVHVPAETMGVLFKHVANSAEQYFLHAQLNIAGWGRTPDGRYPKIENHPLFAKQELYSLDFAGRVISKFHRQAGIELNAELEVKGLEALRGFKTPRVEEIDRQLAERGLPSTPKTRQYAALDTHRPRNPLLTAQQAAANTRTWLFSKGVQVKRVVLRAGQQMSRLFEENKAKRAVRRAIRAVNRLGRPVRASEFDALVLREAIAGRANVDRTERVAQEVRSEPTRYGLLRRSDGSLTTERIERAREKTQAILAKLGRKRAIRPSRQAFHRLALEMDDFAAHREKLTQTLGSRVVRQTDVTAAAALLVRAHALDGRRVFGVAAGRTAAHVGGTFGVRMDDPEAFARRLSRKSLAATALAMRQQPRWRSLRHMSHLHRQLRAPEVKLQRGDVVVLDSRSANQNAMRFIAQKARKAGATVVWINDAATPEVVHTRTQTRDRGRSR